MPGQHTFPRRNRITSKAGYSAVFKKGQRLPGRYFVCYLARQEERDCKLGMAISRKVGNAVVRNRIKRYLREFFRTNKSRFPSAIQMVVVARPAAAELGYHECEMAIGKLLRRGGALSD